MLPSLGHKAMFATKLPHRGWCFCHQKDTIACCQGVASGCRLQAPKCCNLGRSSDVLYRVGGRVWHPKSFGGLPSKWSVEWHLNRKHYS